MYICMRFVESEQASRYFVQSNAKERWVLKRREHGSDELGLVDTASRVCFRQALRRTRQSDQQKAGGPFEVDADEEGI